MIKYRSKLEKRVAALLPKAYKYEPFSVAYRVPKMYTPDFVKSDILIEVKGYFRTYAEASKYIHVRSSNPDREIVFIFQDSRKPMPGVKKRKDGTKLSMGEWATANKFRWCDVDNIKDLKL